jgi:hypothetical protein
LTPSCHDTAPRSANLKRGIHQHPSSSMDPVSSMPVSWNRSSSQKEFDSLLSFKSAKS